MTSNRERTGPVDRSHDLVLASGPTAPAAARAHVTNALVAAGADSGVIAEAMLLVSEIVTDVVTDGNVDRIEVQVFPTAHGWAVLVEWTDPTAVGRRGIEYLPLTGTDPDARRRRRVVDAVPARWWVCDDGLRTTVGIEVATGVTDGQRAVTP